MEETQFDQLLERYVHGQATAQEKAKLELWFEIRKNRGEELVELTAGEQEALFAKITSTLDNEEEIRSFRPLAAAGLRAKNWAWRMAAAVVLLVGVSALVLYFAGSSKVLNLAGVPAVEKLILQDGTLVWLRRDSKLIYFETAQDGLRHGELTGEALFEVAKDPAHPFVIEHGDLTLRVLGTSFSVKAEGENFELKVLTGKVSLTQAGSEKQITVEPHESVVYHRGGPLEKVGFADAEVAVITAHTEYDMHFSNAPLSTVVERISAKFGVKVTLVNVATGKCLITADFTDHSLESTLRMVADVVSARVVRKEGRVELDGPGC